MKFWQSRRRESPAVRIVMIKSEPTRKECQNEILAEPEARITHRPDCHDQIRTVRNVTDGIANPVRPEESRPA